MPVGVEWILGGFSVACAISYVRYTLKIYMCTEILFVSILYLVECSLWKCIDSCRAKKGKIYIKIQRKINCTTSNM